MNMVLNYLQYLGYILIFPGFLFCFVAGLLLCGIDPQARRADAEARRPPGASAVL